MPYGISRIKRKPSAMAKGAVRSRVKGKVAAKLGSMPGKNLRGRMTSGKVKGGPRSGVGYMLAKGRR